MNFLQILAIITAMGSSYWTAKYNASRPHRLQVKQLQLEHVYIPLHHVFMDLPETLNKKQALYVPKKMNSILSKYYEQLFWQMEITMRKCVQFLIKFQSIMNYLKRI